LEPPAIEPPAIEPPAIEPPAIEPPATEPNEEVGTLPAQWRAIADACFERGEFLKARRFYLRLLRSAGNNAWCEYQLGRIDSQEGQWAEAIDKFNSALMEESPNIWIHFEKANALAKLSADPKEVAQELISFVRGSPEGLEKMHESTVLQHAHAVFRAGLHKEAVVLYDWLAESGESDFVCNLRRARLRLENNDPLNALRIVRKLESHDDHEFRAHLLKARALLALDRLGGAVQTLKSVVAQAPANVAAVRLLFAALERAPGSIELRDPNQFLWGLPRAQRFEFLLRATIAREDYQGAVKLCEEYPPSVTSPYAQLIGRAMHAAIHKQDFATSDALFETAGGVPSNAPHLIAVQVLSHLLRKQFEEAGRLLIDAEQLLTETRDPELRHRKLEYLCLSMQIDQASMFLADWIAEGELPEAVTGIVAALYSARGEWNAVLEFLRDRMRRNFQISNDTLLNAVAHATRATGKYVEVLELIKDPVMCTPDSRLRDFRDRLLCEYSLVTDLTGHEPVAAPLVDAIANPFLSGRAKALSQSLSYQRDEVDGNIYFCSDMNYLVGTSVALFSLLKNNFSIREKCTLSVICGDEALDLATDICGRIGGAFSVPIRIIAASKLLGPASGFKSEWGLFSGGHGLSDAAYYRIFAAKQLLAEGARGRALYIDSDTCVGRGIDHVLAFDLKGQPIGARPEHSLPEIARAATRLGIEPTKYFNSGVLLFDLDHHGLPAALDHAVEIAINQKELLTYVDQCALNLAFDGRNTVLPDTFNWLLREATPLETIPPDPIILHFLARPKPWDPMYATVHCMRWVQEFLQLAQLLPPELCKHLLASQFAHLRVPLS
jgi:lipopolysaccharide biosynthesis glycosyltransferase